MLRGSLATRSWPLAMAQIVYSEVYLEEAGKKRLSFADVKPRKNQRTHRRSDPDSAEVDGIAEGEAETIVVQYQTPPNIRHPGPNARHSQLDVEIENKPVRLSPGSVLTA